MPSEDQSVSERTAAALIQLKPVAKEVSAAAEELGKPVTVVDRTLKGMNIAFAAWVTYKSGGDEYEFWHWDVGYSRINARWGIGLRVVSGNPNHPEDADIEEWHFNESPLYLRHHAIEKLPELLEALAKTGMTVARKLTGAVASATAIAEAVSPQPKTKK